MYIVYYLLMLSAYLMYITDMSSCYNILPFDNSYNIKNNRLFKYNPFTSVKASNVNPLRNGIGLFMDLRKPIYMYEFSKVKALSLLIDRICNIHNLNINMDSAFLADQVEDFYMGEENVDLDAINLWNYISFLKFNDGTCINDYIDYRHGMFIGEYIMLNEEVLRAIFGEEITSEIIEEESQIDFNNIDSATKKCLKILDRIAKRHKINLREKLYELKIGMIEE